MLGGRGVKRHSTAGGAAGRGTQGLVPTVTPGSPWRVGLGTQAPFEKSHSSQTSDSETSGTQPTSGTLGPPAIYISGSRTWSLESPLPFPWQSHSQGAASTSRRALLGR